MSKCIKCEREADYISSDSYCKFHWLDWWYDGDGPTYLTDEDEIRLLNLIRTDKPEDHETMESLYEKYQANLEEALKKESD